MAGVNIGSSAPSKHAAAGGASPRAARVGALIVAGVYLAAAAVWLLLSGRIAAALTSSPDAADTLQAVGVWVMILLTAVALFFVARWQLLKRSQPVQEVHRDWRNLTEHLNRLPLAMVEWDREFRISHWSRGAKRLFGWTPEEAEGRSLLDWELVDPSEKEGLSRFLNNVRMDEADGKLLVLRNRHMDGSELWCEWYVSWIRDSQGRLVSILALIHDITPERETMAEVQQLNRDLELRVARRTRELAAANRDLRAFTHSISHDLRTPVEAVIGFAESLRDQFGTELPAEARKHVVYILAAGRQMDHLIEDLVEYARLGSEELVLQPVDVNDAIRHAVRTLEENFPEAAAAVSPPRQAVTVPADRNLLERVLSNLMENSLKYRHPRRPARVVVDAERNDDEVSVLIRDNGLGIPPEHRERVFRLFERLQAEQNHPGSGMGLPIVRKAMSLMGGQITVEDQEGPGTTMRLRFPIYGRLDTLVLESAPGEESEGGTENRATFSTTNRGGKGFTA
jgi:PAS domain S-box-containing protein